MQSDQLQYKLWFTLASLFVIEWPFYSYSQGGGVHFLGELLEQTRSFAAPLGSSRAVQQRYETFRACKMPAALEEGLLTLVDCLPSGSELPSVLKAAAEQPAFAKLLRALGDVHVPLDKYHGLAHIFDIVEAAMGLAWGKHVFLGKTSNPRPSFIPFTAEELYDKYMYAFSESRRNFLTMLLLFRAMRQHVTQKPHTGLVLLLVEQPETPRSKTIPFSKLQDFRVLKAQIRESVQMKLESALTRFYASGRRSSSREMVDLPDIRVSGFFARHGDGRTVEKGLVGVEIDFSLIERFKEETPKFGVMIQVNLLDTWADKTSPDAWPDVLEPYNTVLSAYTATQLLKAELLWDPSLASLAWGRTKLVYSSISEVFEYEKVRDYSSHGSTSTYDPDLHVMLLQSYKEFVAQGREKGVMKRLVDSLKRKPLGHARIPRTFDADRITFQGSAMLLSQAPIRAAEDVQKENVSQPTQTGTTPSSGSSALTTAKTSPKWASALAGEKSANISSSKAAAERQESSSMAGLPGAVVRHLQNKNRTGSAASRQRGKTAIQGGTTESEELEERAGRGKMWESTSTKGWRYAETGVDDVGGRGMRTPQKRQLYRKKEFGAGLNYGEVLQLEKAIRKNTIMLHIKIAGLANAAAEEWQSLQAHEILNRLAQRLRGAFEIHYVEAVKARPKQAAPPRPISRKGFVPDWILALSVCATATFFICCIVLLVRHNNLKLPWWLSCLYSSVSPWEKSTVEHSASRPSPASEDDNDSVSRRRAALKSEIRRRPENMSVVTEDHSRQEKTSPAKLPVVALTPILENVTLFRGIGGRRKLTRPRHVAPTSQEKHKLRWSRASLGLKKMRVIKQRPGRSAEIPGIRDSMATSAWCSDGSNAFEKSDLKSGNIPARAVWRAHGSGFSSCTLTDDTGGSDSNIQANMRYFETAPNREIFIPAPHFLFQRLPESKPESRQKQHESQQQRSKKQRLRRQAELEATILAARCVNRVTRASRIVLENSWCPHPLSSN